MMDLVTIIMTSITFILPLDPSSPPSLHVSFTFTKFKTQPIDNTYTIIKTLQDCQHGYYYVRCLPKPKNGICL